MSPGWRKMKIVLVAGARPNFMKIAPILRAIKDYNEKAQNKAGARTLDPILVHTGQHYDYEMSKVFFEDLEMPDPDVYLGIGSGTHAEQTGKAMIEIEKLLIERKPDLVVVVGDVNSTLAGALAAVKLHIPVAHVEAGLRLFDKTVPEEVNRLLTDAISDYLFTYAVDSDENLKNEGIPQEKIYFVGNVMVDSLMQSKKKASQRNTLSRMGLKNGGYGVLTLHRPDNVDEKESLSRIIKAVTEVSHKIPIVFPAHPRTQKNLKEFGLLPNPLSPVSSLQSPVTDHQLLISNPLGYLDFLQLMMSSKFVLTDSGGIQEETTILNIPCLTLRDSPDRPVTVREGTNTLVGKDSERIRNEVSKILDGNRKTGRVPELWDGKAAERIVAILAKID
jgi:UDP-N-acetylglucosamine 2-epimerase (non-hydrolysing)